MSAFFEKRAGLILIVDDEEFNREMMEAYLQLDGHEVMLANSGEKALEMAFNRVPDLILLDVRLPGINGYETCARFKSTETTRYSPVVMVTGMQSDEDTRKALEAGADDFIQKPINSLLMLNRIRSLLRIKFLYDALKVQDKVFFNVLSRHVDSNVIQLILKDLEVVRAGIVS